MFWHYSVLSLRKPIVSDDEHSYYIIALLSRNDRNRTAPHRTLSAINGRALLCNNV